MTKRKLGDLSNNMNIYSGDIHSVTLILSFSINLYFYCRPYYLALHINKHHLFNCITLNRVCHSWSFPILVSLHQDFSVFCMGLLGLLVLEFWAPLPLVCINIISFYIFFFVYFTSFIYLFCFAL